MRIIMKKIVRFIIILIISIINVLLPINFVLKRSQQTENYIEAYTYSISYYLRREEVVSGEIEVYNDDKRSMYIHLDNSNYEYTVKNYISPSFTNKEVVCPEYFNRENDEITVWYGRVSNKEPIGDKRKIRKWWLLKWRL